MEIIKMVHFCTIDKSFFSFFESTAQEVSMGSVHPQKTRKKRPKKEKKHRKIQYKECFFTFLYIDNSVNIRQNTK